MADVLDVDLSDSALLAETRKAVAGSKLGRAAVLAEEGVQRGLVDPLLYAALGLKAQEDGRDGEAIEELTRSLALSPKNYVLLNAIGVSLVKLKRIQEGLAKFDEAISLQPALAQSYFRKGWAYETLGDRNIAAHWYGQALRFAPNLAPALGALAGLAIRDGKSTQARELAEKALKSDPSESAAILALSRADLVDGSFAGAETRLRNALDRSGLPSQIRAVMLGFLGDALDGQDRMSEAFGAYQASNAIYRELYHGRFGGKSETVDYIARLCADVESMDFAQSRRSTPKSEARTHVFLMGFVRSGTTLLERVLLANPDVVSLEERDTLQPLASRFLGSREALQRLAALDADEAEAARSEYWDAVRALGGKPDGRIFVDKQPLNTFNLPLIATIFPDAKILFALRDPRDVVLSCFRRHFEPGATTYDFLTLETAARYYAQTMRLAEVCREKMRPALLECRYEDLVADFEGTMRRVCRHIGTDWREEMRDFSELAKATSIRSPSVDQVRRPLYREGVGQWRRYEAFLVPTLPILAPWIEKFGYATT
jgi:tetratricopeptide (TPR) repeat protein